MDSHVILQIDNCEQLATKNTILQNSANLFLLGLKCQIMFQLGLYTWKRNLILLRLPLFATIFEKSHEKSHWKIFKHLGLYEILLETYFKHWIPVLGTPKGCPALEQFWFFYLDPPSEHSNTNIYPYIPIYTHIYPINTKHIPIYSHIYPIYTPYIFQIYP